MHLQQFNDLLLVVHAKDMFAQPELADEKNYYKGKIERPRRRARGTDLVGRAGGLRREQAGGAAADRLHASEGGGLHRCWYVGGRWAYASALLDGFSDYILITIDWLTRRSRCWQESTGCRA